ncbi:MAG: hypothetical protein JNJ90_04125 [Saprospiraceae bacterium]|nr:hypothetical protein [Saprospiraceae bacterium]
MKKLLLFSLLVAMGLVYSCQKDSTVFEDYSASNGSIASSRGDSLQDTICHHHDSTHVHHHDSLHHQHDSLHVHLPDSLHQHHDSLHVHQPDSLHQHQPDTTGTHGPGKGPGGHGGGHGGHGKNGHG